jgi:transcriptional regulator with XRE-family HTH domain
MQNPFVRVRSEGGLATRDFAQALGVSVPTIKDAETGVPHDPAAVLEALAKLGHNAEALRADYEEWREDRAREIQEKLKV